MADRTLGLTTHNFKKIGIIAIIPVCLLYTSYCTCVCVCLCLMFSIDMVYIYELEFESLSYYLPSNTNHTIIYI